jgi:hypothetical protein
VQNTTEHIVFYVSLWSSHDLAVQFARTDPRKYSFFVRAVEKRSEQHLVELLSEI